MLQTFRRLLKVSTLLSRFLLMNERVNMEEYLLYSSFALFTMGCLVLAISIIFRLKFREINSLPENLSANVSNKTFIVFNPFPEHRKIIHRFLLVLPMVVLFTSMCFVLIMIKILEYGVLLSFFALLIGLNLIVVEGAFDVYQNSKIFIKAVQDGTSLGVGDLKVLRIMEKLMPKLSNYYLGLSIIFMASSAMLPYIWSSSLLFFAWFIGLIFQASAPTGVISWEVAVFLFVLTLVVVQIFASAVKNKLLTHLMEF
jgi:hypothetical protein